MKDSENKDIYLEILTKIQEKQEDSSEKLTDLKSNMDLHIQKTEMELESIKNLDKQQNQILGDHKKRCDELQRQNDLSEKQLRKEIFGTGSSKPQLSLTGRVQTLEAPRKWLEMTKKGAIWLGALAGALYAIWRIYTTLLT